MKPQSSNFDICEGCLVESVCIKPCEKFKVPSRKYLSSYLKSPVRLKRLSTFHKNEGTDEVYDLDARFRFYLTSNGTTIKYDKLKNMYHLIEDDKEVSAFFTGK